MPAEITTLIEGQDNFERVRDRIAEILVLESAGQQALALAADPPRNPDLWKLRVFVERSAPWEEWQTDPGDPSYNSAPLVNVSVDTGTYNERSSNTIHRQSQSVTYNVDCYGQGYSRETEAGHDPGDEAAAFEAQRAFRLARNILMASVHNYLGLKGTVGKRFPQGFEAFTPALDAQTVVKVQGLRFRLVVDMNEFSPQYEGQSLEEIGVEVVRQGTGEVLLAATFHYTMRVLALGETPEGAPVFLDLGGTLAGSLLEVPRA